MQWEGKCVGRQPYRRHSASLKAPLCRANPCSLMGKVESQLEAPFSADTVKAFWRLLGSLSLSSEAAVASCCLRRVRVSFLALSCSALVSDEYVCDCCKMRATSGAVIFSDALLLVALWRQGSIMPIIIDNFTTSPRSPNYARDGEAEEGLGSGIRNEAMAGTRPIIKGRNWELSSNGCSHFCAGRLC